MIFKNPRLIFTMNLPEKATVNLVEGVLIIREELGEGGTKLRATSGLKQYQFERSWHYKGRGCLPPSKQIQPVNYTVATQRLWMPDVRGVEGSFYAIAPFQVNAGGALRGDFGVHADAGFPKASAGNAGSAGCIVIRQQDHWNIFRNKIAEFRADGHQQIPLTVIYE